MTTKTTKVLLFALMTAVTATSIGIISSNDITAEVQKEIILASNPTNEGWLSSEGDRSVVIVDFAENVDVKRINPGETSMISVTLTHKANNDNVKPVVLRPIGTLGVITPEPYASMYTSQDRAQQLSETGKITGSISLSDYTTSSESLITIPVNESVQVMLYVDIPSNIQDNLKDIQLPFQPAFQVIDGENVRIDNNIQEIEIVSRGDSQ